MHYITKFPSAALEKGMRQVHKICLLKYNQHFSAYNHESSKLIKLGTKRVSKQDVM